MITIKNQYPSGGCDNCGAHSSVTGQSHRLMRSSSAWLCEGCAHLADDAAANQRYSR